MSEKLLKNIPLLLILLFIFGPILGKRGILFLLVILAIFFFIKHVIPDLGQETRKQGGDGPKIIDMDKLNNNLNKFNFNKFKSMHKAKTISLIVLLFFGIWLFFASVQIVDAGETGVYSLFGKVKDKELRSGFHLVIPLAKVTKMSIRTEEYTMSIAQGEGKRYGADAITSLTKEGLSVDLDMTVLYRLDEENASDIYREVGLNYEEKILRPTIRTAIRDIIAQYEAKDIYSEKREEAAKRILENLKSTLEDRGMIIENVLLRNVALPLNLSKAIQEKLQAEQEAQKYVFVLQKEEKEKERKVIEAEGRRDSQKIINESLTTNYLYFLYINELKDREGTIYVPINPSTGMPMFRDLGR